MSSLPIDAALLLLKINHNPYILCNILNYAIGIDSRLISKKYKDIFSANYENNYIYKIRDISKVSDVGLNSLINNTNFILDITIKPETYNDQITRISHLLKVKRPFNRIHKLNLYCCTEITDVSLLGNVHTLIFMDCPGITDVSALENVHTLYMNMCIGITDVSSLGNVHTLIFNDCPGITDVSALGKDQRSTLYLSGCTRITDVSALGNIHTLYLSGCYGITDVSALGNVYKLVLSGSMVNNIITDLSSFTNIVYW